MISRLTVALCLCLTALTTLKGEEVAQLRRLQGEIGGAKWAALAPAAWNHRLLLVAPDRRNAPAPLVAELDETAPDLRPLLAAGWTVATTSYRRTGPILVDAIEDLRALRAVLATEIGTPDTVIVAGSGMGGLVATLVAERNSDEFHGLLAREPRLEIRDPRALRLKVDGQPRAPLLILFGATTARSVIAYHDRARAAANAESFVPALWFQPEEDDPPAAAAASFAEAVEALAAWAQDHRAPADRLEDLPAADELPAEAAEATEKPTPAEAPPLPDEPPPTVPVDSTPVAR